MVSYPLFKLFILLLPLTVNCRNNRRIQYYAIVSPFVGGSYQGNGQPNQVSYPGTCPVLANPYNGYVQGVCGPNASPGSVCVYRCYRGFQAQGARALTCLDGGYWDNDPPV